jgi:hypothetical protein
LAVPAFRHAERGSEAAYNQGAALIEASTDNKLQELKHDEEERH